MWGWFDIEAVANSLVANALWWAVGFVLLVAVPFFVRKRLALCNWIRGASIRVSSSGRRLKSIVRRIRFGRPMLLNDLMWAGTTTPEWWETVFERRHRILVGEGHPILIGMAQVSETGGRGKRVLRLYSFGRPGTAWLEMRMTGLDPAHRGQRKVEITFDGVCFYRDEYAAGSEEVRTATVCHLNKARSAKYLFDAECILISWEDVIRQSAGTVHLDGGVAKFSTVGFGPVFRRLDSRMMRCTIGTADPR